MNNLVIDGKILFSREESSAEETELFCYVYLKILSEKREQLKTGGHISFEKE